MLRGLLLEQGVAVPAGARTLVTRVASVLADSAVPLSDLLRHTLGLVLEEVRAASTRLTSSSRGLPRPIRSHLA